LFEEDVSELQGEILSAFKRLGERAMLC